jgi:hypothetical protein
MSYEPATRAEIAAMIADALAGRDEETFVLWQRVRIEPAKWRCSPEGDERGGFWALAIDGDRVLWLNDIDDGFNWSRFSERGTIDEYLFGEYTTYASLREMLDELRRAESDRVWKTLHDHDVPAALAGAGAITRRQTTYWELHTASGASYRVHFRDKAEVVFTGAVYSHLEIATRHPLLVAYETPLRQLYFSGTPIDARRLADTLADRVRAISDGWRSLDEYNRRAEATLRAGHGLFMNAPEPICAAVAEVLEDAGLGASVLGAAPARGAHQALVLARSFVIARAFAFEPRLT